MGQWRRKMQNSVTTSEFTPGDVGLALKLHANTAEFQQDKRGFNVEGKKRPALIVGEKSSNGDLQVCWFTSQKPKPSNLDFLRQETGKPRSFGSMLGFEQTSYLEIYPLGLCPSSKMSPTRIKKFPREFVDNVIKEYTNRMMRPGG
jgi:hypothetical protein